MCWCPNASCSMTCWDTTLLAGKALFRLSDGQLPACQELIHRSVLGSGSTTSTGDSMLVPGEPGDDVAVSAPQSASSSPRPIARPQQQPSAGAPQNTAQQLQFGQLDFETAERPLPGQGFSGPQAPAQIPARPGAPPAPRPPPPPRHPSQHGRQQQVGEQLATMMPHVHIAGAHAPAPTSAAPPPAPGRTAAPAQSWQANGKQAGVFLTPTPAQVGIQFDSTCWCAHVILDPRAHRAGTTASNLQSDVAGLHQRRDPGGIVVGHA